MEHDVIRDTERAYPLKYGRKTEGIHTIDDTGKGIGVREQLLTENPSFSVRIMGMLGPMRSKRTEKVSSKPRI
jgi:hypothetical protein